MLMDLHLISSVATAAAHRGGGLLRAKLGNLDHIEKKGAIDLVTEADTGSEAIILNLIRGAFPEHSVLTEESGSLGGNSDCQWIIDPLDGTTNFAHGIGLFAVSIAFAHAGEIQVGVVLNPVSGELFTGVKGEGARLNGRPIHVSATQTLADSLLVTGFPYDFKSILPSVMARFSRCLQASQGVRRLGSAALDLCYVACGRFEGFWEQNLNPWDTAAGLLIAREAGAAVTGFKGDDYSPFDKKILATNGHIHTEMIDLMALQENDEETKQ
ncbi:MAG: inositol monophosphatase family protein [Desulfobacterales bacterium]